VNTEEIYPPAVQYGEAPYPEDCCFFFKKHYGKVISFNAAELAQKAGNIKTANVVLLGAVSNLMTLINQSGRVSLEIIPGKIG